LATNVFVIRTSRLLIRQPAPINPGSRHREPPAGA